MPDNIAYPSLCSTCKHTAKCHYATGARGPSFYCEEFEIESVPARIPWDTPRPQDSLVVSNEAVNWIGLCCDCENRQTCVFLRPEGGVWHCEEYR
jgi:hypothetical protein